LRSGPLSVATAERILTHVARALARLHDAGCVHRDLKPSNVFLVANEEEIIAKVLDFGIVKTNLPALEPTPLTRTGEQMGTPYYMSPEQIRGLRNIDFRADIWALGVLGFECLVGKRPFDGETMGDLSLKICADPIAVPSQFGRVPDGFDAWFLRCVERQRERTFGSARDAIEALRGVLVVNAAGEAPSAVFDDHKAASAASSTGSSVGPSGQRPSHWPRWMWWVPALLVAALGLRLALRQHDAAQEHTVSGSQPAATSFSDAAPSSEPKRSANQNEQQPTASAPEPATEARSAAESKPKQADLRAPRGRPVRSNAPPPAAPTASSPSSVGSARSSTGPARDLIEDRL
jgi:serine/threonine-protein kinase